MLSLLSRDNSSDDTYIIGSTYPTHSCGLSYIYLTSYVYEAETVILRGIQKRSQHCF